jgi:hypothetical protein
MSDKQSILDHFGGDFSGFYSRYLPDLKRAKANCPFHDCDSKSLSVDTKSGLFKCHFPECRASGDVFKFYALKHNLNGNFPAVLEGIAADFRINTPTTQKKASGRIVKTYDYTDAEGKLLFQVCRMEPKDFRQRRPDGKGGWIWNMEGVGRVLYWLPEVLKSDGVMIVEGEKDVENLRALGFTATTNAGGAGKWLPSYSDTLAGKKVFIFPDNDEAGRKHAENVAWSLYGNAASIKVIEIPGLPNKGDVSDFIAGIGDPETVGERLCIMAEGAAEYEPAKEEAENLRAGQQQESAAGDGETRKKPGTPRPATMGWCAADLMATEFPEPRWAVPGIIPEGLTLLAGKPKRGKSILAMNLGIAISSGGKALGWSKVEPGEVLYLALEDNPRRLKNRLSKMNDGGQVSPRLWLFTQWPKMNEGGLDLLAADVENHADLRLIVIDTLPKFRPPKPKNADPYQFDYETGNQIKAFADSVGVAVLVICHLRKTESEDRLDDVSGTFGVTGSADGTIVLVRNTGQADGTLIVSGRDVEETELALRFDPNFLSWNIIGNANEIKSTEMKQKLYDAIRGYGAAFSPRQIAAFSGLNENYVKRMIPYLERENGLKKLSRGRYELPLNISL